MGDEMRHGISIEMSDRYALHEKGNKIIMPIAKTAARAAFDACGGDEDCKSWTMISGTMRGLAHKVMETFLGENPDASAETLYEYLMNFPASGMLPPDDRAGRIFDKAPRPWAQAPMPVRAAYEAFCGVYRELWRAIRAHDATMAQALPRRAPPRLVFSAPKPETPEELELRSKMKELGFNDHAIKKRLECISWVPPLTAAEILAYAEEDAAEFAWWNEMAKKHPSDGYPRLPQFKLKPERVYLREVYDKYVVRWGVNNARARKI